MNEINVAQMKKELADKLIASGIAEDCARQAAAKEVDGMGAVKTTTGQCPLGEANPMACMFCRYGHMMECHYPQTCSEAECSHYQSEQISAGDYAGFLEE